MEGPVALRVPAEILLEIIAYFHNPNLSYERCFTAPSDKILCGRFEVLHALSQTCRYFRRVFLFLAWEYTELVGRDRATANVLTRRMTGILKTPSVWRWIRTVIVSLVFSPQDSWTLPTVFVRVLAATSHLTCLRIIAISESHGSALTEVLQTRSFPSVQILAIPSSLARSLSSFPNIHSLSCADNLVSDYHSIALLKASSKHCHSLEALMNLTPSLSVIKCLLKSHPLIKTLGFRHILTSDMLKLLGDLQNLHSLKFPCRYQKNWDNTTITATLEAIFACSLERKSIQVEYSAAEADVGDVVVTVSTSAA
ncbi:hypothetical protein MSAN_02010200 [Mycena sanguinolenta]|uniref:F-box domain-containing protein n=1 Tax=Mycena sanguinolenta TaxID=230812 RepID=A0A8H6XJ74_9AGAR|nr:hypothetical protein MSAN_02010200 [Mycena sanguinolenta]